MTDTEAKTISNMMIATDLFPEARKLITRDLLDYYKALLYREPRKPIPTVRRML